jgi:hypothetical protein
VVWRSTRYRNRKVSGISAPPPASVFMQP